VNVNRLLQHMKRKRVLCNKKTYVDTKTHKQTHTSKRKQLTNPKQREKRDAERIRVRKRRVFTTFPGPKMDQVLKIPEFLSDVAASRA